MQKLIATITLSLAALFAYSQYYSGYYVSAPQVHEFDHFKIKQEKNTQSKFEGDLDIHAYCSKKEEIWEMVGTLVTDEERKSFLIQEYGQNKEIISVHALKFLWDGNEWEYFLLGYLGEDKHRHFVVVEEIFNDESETELLSLSKFDWVKAHHITKIEFN
jgi:hypothetical protein